MASSSWARSTSCPRHACKPSEGRGPYVQHINAFPRADSGDWTCTFTQEWPVPDQKHQLSFALPVAHADEHTGLGDLALNYRYQLIGDGDARAAMAPRVPGVAFPVGIGRTARPAYSSI